MYFFYFVLIKISLKKFLLQPLENHSFQNVVKFQRQGTFWGTFYFFNNLKFCEYFTLFFHHGKLDKKCIFLKKEII